MSSIYRPVGHLHPADYALRRMSDARTRARSCSGVSGDLSAGLDFAGTGAAGFAAPVAVSRSASRLAARSFALASIASAGEPSRATRCSWASTALQYAGAIFQRASTPSVYGSHQQSDLPGRADR